MPTSTFTFYNDFVEQCMRGVHNFGTDVVKVALTNTAPNVATHTVLADIGQIGTAGGYTGGAGGGLTLDTQLVSETAGVATFDVADEVFTATGGNVGPFRYAVFYNDTPTSPVDPLIGFLDYGTSITLFDGEPLSIPVPTGLFNLAKP